MLTSEGSTVDALLPSIGYDDRADQQSHGHQIPRAIRRTSRSHWRTNFRVKILDREANQRAWKSDRWATRDAPRKKASPVYTGDAIMRLEERFD